MFFIIIIIILALKLTFDLWHKGSSSNIVEPRQERGIVLPCPHPQVSAKHMEQLRKLYPAKEQEPHRWRRQTRQVGESEVKQEPTDSDSL